MKSNQKAQGITTVNKAGGKAYDIKDLKTKLMTQVLTNFVFEDKYYGDTTKEMLATIREVVKKDAKFIANLAIYARNEFFMRSVSHILVVELAQDIEGKKLVRETIKKVVLRADDVTEIMSYQLKTYGKPIPNSIKKGIADCINTFDEYSLAKYKGEGKELKMRDVVKLTHPKRSELLQKLIEDRLEIPMTWETQISTKGNKAEVWNELINNKKLGYMASLRNLRNIANSGADINKVLDYLTNENAVKNSKQLPFRFYSAYNEIKNSDIDILLKGRILIALERAMTISISNLPKFEGKTLIIVDNSGSMAGNLSDKSKMTFIDVASVSASIANEFCENSDVVVFGTTHKKVLLNKEDGILNNVKKIKDTYVGHSTELNKVFEWLLTSKEVYDRIIVFSDMQCYNVNAYGYRNTKTVQSYFFDYQLFVNPKVQLHSIDLHGYGTQQFVGNNVNLLAGWNDKVISFCHLAENEKENLISKISNYYF